MSDEMNTDSTGRCVWQLPVSGAENRGNAYIHKSAKYHCFLDDHSLCGEYWQMTSDYDDGISATHKYIKQHPDKACKRCYRKWKNASPERRED